MAIATGLNTKAYSDLYIQKNKTYYYSVGAEKNGLEKISGDFKFYAFDSSLFKIRLPFSANLLDKTGRAWTATGSPTIQDYILYLNGNGQFLTTPSTTDLNLNHSNDFTIRFKIKLDGANASSSSTQVILSKRALFAANGGAGYEILCGGGALVFSCWDASGNSINLGVSVPLLVSEYAEISIERKNMVVRSYKNGAKISENTQTTLISQNAQLLTIGRTNQTAFVPLRDFKGYIADLEFIVGLAVGDGQPTTPRF